MQEIVWRGVVQTTLGKSLSAADRSRCRGAALRRRARARRGLTGGPVAPIVAHLVWDFSVLHVHPLAPPVLLS
ncbi:MAG: hypothetical protein ABI321_14505 [Polyangia bacterium]